MCRFIWLLMLGGLLAASGCDRKPADQMAGKVTSEDVRHDVGQALNTAADLSQQTKEEFQKSFDARLKELDAKIVQLREKGRDLKDQAKTDWDRKLTDLETKRDAAHAKLAEIGHSSAAAWKDVQNGAQSVWDELEKSFQVASGEF